jgi:hypothetical protein
MTFNGERVCGLPAEDCAADRAELRHLLRALQEARELLRETMNFYAPAYGSVADRKNVYYKAVITWLDQYSKVGE